MHQIRPASTEDAEELWELRSRAIRTGCASHYSTDLLIKWTEGPPPPAFYELLSQRMFITTVESDLVGSGTIDGHSGKVDFVFVDPSRMGKGLGKEMVHHLEALGQELGFKMITLDSTLNAVSFYRRLGYEGEETIEYRSQRGLLLDLVPMKKWLS